MNGATFDQYSAYFGSFEESQAAQAAAESNRPSIDNDLPTDTLSHTTSTLFRRHNSETTVGKGKRALRRSVRSVTTVKSDETITPSETIKTCNTTKSETIVTKPHVHFRGDEKPEASYDYEHLKITTSRGRGDSQPHASRPGEVVLTSASNVHHPTVVLKDHAKSPPVSPATSLKSDEEYWQSRRRAINGKRPTLAQIGVVPCDKGHVVGRRVRSVKRWASRNILRKKPVPIPSPAESRMEIE